MKLIQRLALEEELEVNKLHNLELAATKDSKLEVLYDNLATKLEDENAAKADDSEEGDGESVEQDTQSPVDADTSASMEHFRGLTYAPEDYDEEGTRIGASIRTVATNLKHTIVMLASLGVTYGPAIVKNVYKGVLYVFVGLVRILYDGISMASRYLDRHINSFENHKKTIAELRTAISTSKQPDGNADSTTLKYTNQKVINALKIGDSVDFAKNIDVLSGFVKNTVNGIDVQVGDNISAIKHVIAYAQTNTVKVPTNILAIKPLSEHMVPGVVEGYPGDDDFTESYKYSEALPSDITLIAQLPRAELTGLEEMTKAYNHSKMFLGVDASSYKDISSVDYMTADELKKLLQSLDVLCSLCLEHKRFYQRVKDTKNSMRYSFKNYFLDLIGRGHKVSMKSSLIEYIYLKAMFIDKVYLVTAMDIHDYTSKIISHGLSYVKDNVKQLSQ